MEREVREKCYLLQPRSNHSASRGTCWTFQTWDFTARTITSHRRRKWKPNSRWQIFWSDLNTNTASRIMLCKGRLTLDSHWSYDHIDPWGIQHPYESQLQIIMQASGMRGSVKTDQSTWRWSKRQNTFSGFSFNIFNTWVCFLSYVLVLNFFKTYSKWHSMLIKLETQM